MRLSKPLRFASRIFHSLLLKCRRQLPPQRCRTFVSSPDDSSGIGPIYVINLDRQPRRWLDVFGELHRILDADARPLSARIVRCSACDARVDPAEFEIGVDVDPYYTLAEQLFVEPQPHAMPEAFDLEQPIRMTQAEIAIARSHINTWKTIAQSSAPYALVLEDDVWFRRDFGKSVEQAWREMEGSSPDRPKFDLLYVSYTEARHGAPKELISSSLFRPERGLWCLSGYVLSKKGAQALLNLLPCRGPIDLWINHKFDALNVRALRRSVVNQRRDLHSTNSYSILPALGRIGVLNGGDASLFHRRPAYSPVFAFGIPGSGLSSLAMALSMLGYRCCSDLDEIPEMEYRSLLAGRADRVFNAYVNIGSLGLQIETLVQRYPNAKYILLADVRVPSRLHDEMHDALEGTDVLNLDAKQESGWGSLCQHLRLPPPDAPYPRLPELGMRHYEPSAPSRVVGHPAKRLRGDPSPWIVEHRAGWSGIDTITGAGVETSHSSRVRFEDDFTSIDDTHWLVRTDTFPGNLALFRPANVAPAAGGGLTLTVGKQSLGVRDLGAAALSTRATFLFGRFEATLQATNTPGVVTGFFLHRNSPRQEIDVEIRGNQPNELLANVFYNPGAEGAKFDYGYRGTPVVIKLGFDASKAVHRYAIEWDQSEIRWFVDDRLVHRRTTWHPTPIPNLPMTLHVNNWPTSSRELAGRIAARALPVSAYLRQITLDANIGDPRASTAIGY